MLVRARAVYLLAGWLVIGESCLSAWPSGLGEDLGCGTDFVE